MIKFFYTLICFVTDCCGKQYTIIASIALFYLKYNFANFDYNKS